MATNSFKESFSKKSNEDLLKIVGNERDSYTQEAIKEAEAILTERGAEFISPETGVTTPEEGKPSKPIMPFIIGALMILIAFYKPTAKTDVEAAMTVTIVFNVFIRIVVVGWLFSLTEKFRLNRNLWLTLGLIFGGWTLMAVNIMIWTKNENIENDSDILDYPTDEEVHSDHTLKICPSCQHALEGTESVCPNCHLSLK